MESELCTGAICDLRVRRKTEELSFFAAASRFFPLLLRSLAKKSGILMGFVVVALLG